MPDEKISQLDAVTDVLDDDDYVLARAGASKRITGASLKADLGGSMPVPVTSGDGPPLGTVTPSAVGELYFDLTNGGLWSALALTDADWLIIGGGAPGLLSGVAKLNPGTPLAMVADGSGNGIIYLTDVPSTLGTGNYFAWIAGTADGEQRMEAFLGDSGQHRWQWNADGSTHFPHDNWFVNAGGYECVTHQSAPADDDIQPGQCFSWFDATNGAARFNRKGKTLDGTVVSVSTPMT